jgi:hypothetical protein
MQAPSGVDHPVFRLAGFRGLAFVLACVGAVSVAEAQEPTTQEFWRLAGLMEVAVPFTEDKVEAVLGTGVSKTERGNPPEVAYHTSGFWLKDRSRIEEATWMPKNATSASALTVVRPVMGSRLDVCVTRAEVSRQYGAPTRSWKSSDGDATNTNFEFTRPKTKISVAFSDVTNCLRSLTVAELN